MTEEFGEYFTYIIRSNNKDSATDSTNDCSIRLGNLPQQYTEFEVETSILLSDEDQIFTSTTIDMRASNFGILNGGDTITKSLQTVAIFSFNNRLDVPFIFRCENFNNKIVNFKLYQDDNSLFTSDFNNAGVDNYNGAWVLVFKMRGVKKYNSTKFIK